MQMNLTGPPLSLGVVILAGGRSSRMGKPKMLLPWGGTSVIGHIVKIWAAVMADQVAIVCAKNDQALALELDRLNFSSHDRILNEAPEGGMFSSILCAAAWQGWRPDLTHWAIVLGDQPHLSLDCLRQLLRFAGEHRATVCQPSFGGRARHPVVLPREAFLQLRSSTVGTLKQFLTGRPVALWESLDPRLALDLDRPADYECAVRRGFEERLP